MAAFAAELLQSDPESGIVDNDVFFAFVLWVLLAIYRPQCRWSRFGAQSRLI